MGAGEAVVVVVGVVGWDVVVIVMNLTVGSVDKAVVGLEVVAIAAENFKNTGQYKG